MKLTTKERKKFRVRSSLKKVSSKERYRLSVSRSARNISDQIIDNVNKITLVSASSLKKELKIEKKNKIEISKLVAEHLASKAKEKKNY